MDDNIGPGNNTPDCALTFVILSQYKSSVKKELHTIATQVVERFRSEHSYLCFAESCTGGLLSSLITDVPGASDIFLGGVVAYHVEAKTSLLNVPASLLYQHGPVSAEVAQAMALGAIARFSLACPAGARLVALSTTGVAGPGGGTPSTPVGLCHLVLASTRLGEKRDSSTPQCTNQKLLLPPSFTRKECKEGFAHAAFQMLLKDVQA